MKIWEKDFVNVNGGWKLSWDDIKKDLIIGVKYSEYNKFIGRVLVWL